MSNEKLELDQLAAEAERGYCTEWLGGTHYCLKPAVAEVHQVGLACEQHVRGWPQSIIHRLDQMTDGGDTPAPIV